MNDEENKAIDNFKKLDFFEYDWDIGNDDIETRDEMLVYAKKMQKIILNVISKQQKEIEEKNIAINKMSKDISRQLEEIEEKSTIIMAGAEKVKQLEKEIERLNFENHMVKKWNEQLDKNFISKDKIREKIKAFQDVKKEIIKNENKLSRASITYDIVRNDYCEKMLNQLLEEN